MSIHFGPTRHSIGLPRRGIRFTNELDSVSVVPVTDGSPLGLLLALTKTSVPSGNNWKFMKSIDDMPGPVVLQQMNPGHGFIQAGSNGTIEDTSDSNGNYLRLTTNGTTNNTDIRKTVTPFNAAGKCLCILVRFSAIESMSAIRVTLGNSGYTTGYQWLNPQGTYATSKYTKNGEWRLFQIPFANASVLGSADITAINSIQFAVASNGVNGCTVDVKGFYLMDMNPGVVSFRYDDGFASTYSTAFPLHQSYGYKFSLALAKDLVDSSATYLSTAQINEMVSSGLCEIVYHDTGVWTDYSAAALRARIEGHFSWYTSKGWPIPKVAAYPSHLWRDTSDMNGTFVRDVLSEYFRAAVGGDETLHGVIPPFDYLRHNNKPIVRGTVTPATINGFLTSASARGGHLIQLYHQLVASGITDTATQYLTADHATNLANVAASGLPVKTIGEALQIG